MNALAWMRGLWSVARAWRWHRYARTPITLSDGTSHRGWYAIVHLRSGMVATTQCQCFDHALRQANRRRT